MDIIMTPIQDKELCYVAVPVGARNIYVDRTPALHYFPTGQPDDDLMSIQLPPGSWEPVGMMPGMSEETAHKAVEDCPYYAKCWKNYLAPIETEKVKHPPEWHKDWSCGTRSQSLTSRMEAAGVKEWPVFVLRDKDYKL